MSITDVRHGIVPRRAVWSVGLAVAALLAAAAALNGSFIRFGWAVVAMAPVAAFFEIVYRFRPHHIGFGDIRLIWVNSLLAGWWGLEWPWLALAAGAVVEWPVALVAVRRHGRTARVRWAPGLVAGTALALGYCVWRFGMAG